MVEPLRLIGFKHSVYTWIVRFALAEMGMLADYVETNPFSDPPDSRLAEFTRFDRVPVLEHGSLRLTETAAIVRYLDAIGPHQSLQPTDAAALAQMAQVIGIVDADVYPIMIRQVFSAGYYMPVVMGERGDPSAVAQGLEKAVPALATLDRISRDGRQLSGYALSLADLHLSPMMSYFTRVPEASEVLQQYPALNAWWHDLSTVETLISTDPLGGMPRP